MTPSDPTFAEPRFIEHLDTYLEGRFEVTREAVRRWLRAELAELAADVERTLAKPCAACGQDPKGANEA